MKDTNEIKDYENKIVLLKRYGFVQVEKSTSWTKNHLVFIDIEWELKRIESVIEEHCMHDISSSKKGFNWTRLIVILCGVSIGIILGHLLWNNVFRCDEEYPISYCYEEYVEDILTIIPFERDYELQIPFAFESRETSEQSIADREYRISQQGFPEGFNWEEHQFLYHIRRQIHSASTGGFFDTLIWHPSENFPYRIWTDNITSYLESLGYIIQDCQGGMRISWTYAVQSGVSAYNDYIK